MGLRKILVLFILLIFLAPAVWAKSIKIKLGTFAPEATFWVKDLKKMGASWKKQSKGKVKLRIYAGGVAGDEPAMVRKLIGGQLTAASLTTLGLNEIVSDILVFNSPLMFRNEKEVRYVLKNLSPMLEKKFEEKGFKVLHWSILGSVYLFSQKKVVTPQDLESLKLYVDLPQGASVYRGMGFKTEELSPTGLLKALSPPFPMVHSYITSPIYSLANQWFGLAKNMMDLPITPAIAATIVRTKTWNKIDPKLRPQFLEMAKEIGKNAEVKMGSFDLAVKEAMIKNGLKIHTLNPNQRKAWQVRFAQSYPEIKSNVSSSTFTKVEQLLRQIRQ